MNNGRALIMTIIVGKLYIFTLMLDIDSDVLNCKCFKKCSQFIGYRSLL